MTRGAIRTIAVVVVALGVFGATTGIGVSLSAAPFNPLDPGGTVPDARLEIESERLTYSGLDATAATLVIHNTDSHTHTADISLILMDSNRNGVTAAATTSVTLADNATKPVTIDLPGYPLAPGVGSEVDSRRSGTGNRLVPVAVHYPTSGHWFSLLTESTERKRDGHLVRRVFEEQIQELAVGRPEVGGERRLGDVQGVSDCFTGVCPRGLEVATVVRCLENL